MVDIQAAINTYGSNLSNPASNFYAYGIALFIGVCFLLIFGVSIYMFFRTIRYNIRVEIIKKLGSGTVTYWDKGAVEEPIDAGFKILRLASAKRRKHKIPLPDNKYFAQCNGAFNKGGIIRLYQIGEDDYTPLSPEINETNKELEPKDYNRTMAYLHTKQVIDAKIEKKTMLMQYMPVFLSLTVLVVFVIAIYIVTAMAGQAVNDAMSMGKQISEDNLKAVELNAKANEKLTNVLEHFNTEGINQNSYIFLSPENNTASPPGY